MTIHFIIYINLLFTYLLSNWKWTFPCWFVTKTVRYVLKITAIPFISFKTEWDYTVKRQMNRTTRHITCSHCCPLQRTVKWNSKITYMYKNKLGLITNLNSRSQFLVVYAVLMLKICCHVNHVCLCVLQMLVAWSIVRQCWHYTIRGSICYRSIRSVDIRTIGDDAGAFCFGCCRCAPSVRRRPTNS